ncbi:MAG: DUF1284 domain-containing protein [Methanobrevibacter sp.]|jgi:hypothetical protein|nr:DUF1284 domain-containing protein [Candidatus Methanoflexus mossambicus]
MNIKEKITENINIKEINTKDNVIKLRGHHILCIQGFQGYGYDENFTENLKKIVNSIENFKIQIVNANDDVCEKCPYLKDEKCLMNLNHFKNNETNNNQDKIKKSNEIIKKMDQKVINNMNLKINSYYTYIDLKNRINETFKTKKSLEAICLNCKWENECLFIQSKE